MSILKFTRAARTKDNRNVFGINKEAHALKEVDIQLAEFYSLHNPVDVEVDSRWGAVRFFPFEELTSVQSEYSVANYFVFAEVNGDPVAIANGAIFLGVHGAIGYQFQEIALNLSDFLDKLTSDL